MGRHKNKDVLKKLYINNILIDNIKLVVMHQKLSHQNILMSFIFDSGGPFRSYLNRCQSTFAEPNSFQFLNPVMVKQKVLVFQMEVFWSKAPYCSEICKATTPGVLVVIFFFIVC